MTAIAGFLTEDGVLDDDLLDALTLERIRRAKNRLCLVCGAALADGVRADATYCRDGCRKADGRFHRALLAEVFDELQGHLRSVDLENSRVHQRFLAAKEVCVIRREGASRVEVVACLRHLMEATPHEHRGSIAHCPQGLLACRVEAMRGAWAPPPTLQQLAQRPSASPDTAKGTGTLQSEVFDDRS